MTTLTELTARMRELASKATPGPYLAEHNVISSHVVLGSGLRLGSISVPYLAWHDIDRQPREKQQTEYFSSLDPANITRLLDALAAAQAVVEALRKAAHFNTSPDIREAIAAYDRAAGNGGTG